MPKPKKYDQTSFKANINKYLKDINDVLTSGEMVDQYVDFIREVLSLNAITKYYYTVNEADGFKVLDNKDKERSLGIGFGG